MIMVLLLVISPVVSQDTPETKLSYHFGELTAPDFIQARDQKDHYAGDGSSPQKTLGELKFDSRAEQLVLLIKNLKENDSISDLQDRFYKESENPLKTTQ